MSIKWLIWKTPTFLVLKEKTIHVIARVAFHTTTVTQVTMVAIDSHQPQL